MDSSHQNVPRWMTFIVIILIYSPLNTTSSFQLGRRSCPWGSNTPRGGSVSTLERNNGTLYAVENNTIVLNSMDTPVTTSVTMKEESVSTDDKVLSESGLSSTTHLGHKPWKVLFLSADTGGGHRASAQSLMHQFEKYYPGTTFEMLDIWTPTNNWPMCTLEKSYKHLSANPLHWKILYHLSNSRPYEILADFYTMRRCFGKIKKMIDDVDADIVVSVHPTMNYLPEKVVREISKEKGKKIPFFTVVTDFGSGHCTWFQPNVNKMYIASERIKKLAKRRGWLKDHQVVMTGLPIREDFAVQAERMGDRTSDRGKAYRAEMKRHLRLNPDKKMVLVMGGGEGVGSLAKITRKIYLELRANGVDATICVVCGRNEKLKADLETMDWDAVVQYDKAKKEGREKKKRFPFLRSKKVAELSSALHQKEGQIDVVGLGFVSNMAEFMVAADVLVSKAGPGTIAEAASIGLPVMLTSFLPGQEAGNVDIVLDGGFGAFHQKPRKCAEILSSWLKDDNILDTMARKSALVGHPHAAADIIKDIGKTTVQYLKE